MDEFYSMQSLKKAILEEEKEKRGKGGGKEKRPRERHLKIYVEKKLNLFSAVPVRRTRSTEQKWKKEHFI